jgi:hypothetical protein
MFEVGVLLKASFYVRFIRPKPSNPEGGVKSHPHESLPVDFFTPKKYSSLTHPQFRWVADEVNNWREGGT